MGGDSGLVKSPVRSLPAQPASGNNPSGKLTNAKITRNKIRPPYWAQRSHNSRKTQQESKSKITFGCLLGENGPTVTT